MALTWVQRGSLKGATGDTGAQGAAGVGIDSAQVNGSGDLIITLTDTSQVNAGHVEGAPGGGIDFSGSVATAADLPVNDPYGTARYVRDDGHLYVFEAAADRPEAADGWTDVGAIKGDPGATGPTGAAGRGITNAAVDSNGHLVLTFSDTGATDLGVVRGADGAAGPAGADGATGPRGQRIESFSGTTPPALTDQVLGDLAISETTGDLFKVIDGG